MNTPNPTTITSRPGLVRALSALNPSARLQAALDIGTRPDSGAVSILVERCALEPDFFVRDMLTWALTRHPTAEVVPRLLVELESAIPQARSQALHTLSKIGDPAVWPHLTRALLQDADAEVARSAWRAAVVLVPEADLAWLAEILVTQLGRGDTDMERSLSRALVTVLIRMGADYDTGAGSGAGEVVRLGDTHDDDGGSGVGEDPAAGLGAAARSANPEVAAHARATLALLADPEADFVSAIEEAKRVWALGAEA